MHSSALAARWACLVVLMSSWAGAAVEFRELAADAGIRFRHDGSKSDAKHLLEAMGAGVGMLDYDGDGLLDLYFVNGADISNGSQTGAIDKSDPRFWNRLYRNQGNWEFEDVTAEARAAGSGYGMGVAVADYDGDGDEDLFVSHYGPDLLLRNAGDGTFDDVSADAGVAGTGWSAGAAFFDFDNDGYLDLFVARYLDWTLATSRPCGSSVPGGRSYCHPREFGPAGHALYRNLGGGVFEDVSASTGISGHPGKGLGVAVEDYDGDGWADVFVANDSYPQQLFRNVDGARFEEVAVRVGAAYDSEGRDYAGMGVVWSDYDGDLLPDLLVNALGRQGYWIYRNTLGQFEPSSRESGIAAISELRSGWGMGLVDFDNDGWRDLLVTQGHVMDDIADSDPALGHREPLMLARNLFGRFFDIASQAGPVFREKFAARGAAFGDLDGDGRIDIAINVSDGTALLLRNVSASGNGVTVRLEGKAPNRNAIGATVRLRSTDGTEQHAFCGSAGSYLSASSRDLHFGLGEDGRCASIEVTWPDRTTQTVSRPHGALVVVRQSE